MSDGGEALLQLFGLRYDDEAISGFLSGRPGHQANKPSDGAQFVVCKDGGFGLLFEDRNTGGSPAIDLPARYRGIRNVHEDAAAAPPVQHCNWPGKLREFAASIGRYQCCPVRPLLA